MPETLLNLAGGGCKIWWLYCNCTPQSFQRWNRQTSLKWMHAVKAQC